MKYSSAAAFRQALERRLGDRSRSGAESLVRLRKMVVFDRFLARLAAVGGKRWVLKGAVALEIRLGSGGRTTKDMDVVRRDDEESATADLIAAQATDLGDHFAFAVEKVVGPTNAETKATRYRVRAELAGRLFEEVMLDVGFSDPLRWQPDMLRGPDLLSFAEIEPAEVPALPLEQQVAEASTCSPDRRSMGAE